MALLLFLGGLLLTLSTGADGHTLDNKGMDGQGCKGECLNCLTKINERRECIDWCKKGFWGEKCQMNCPDNCFNSTCERTNGTCVSCKDGFYGDNCTHPCDTRCKDAKCFQNGTCLNCESTSHYGDRCEKSCGPGCEGSSCSRDGLCDCIKGWTDIRCDIETKSTDPQCLEMESIGNRLANIETSVIINRTILIIILLALCGFNIDKLNRMFARIKRKVSRNGDIPDESVPLSKRKDDQTEERVDSLQKQESVLTIPTQVAEHSIEDALEDFRDVRRSKRIKDREVTS